MRCERCRKRCWGTVCADCYFPPATQDAMLALKRQDRPVSTRVIAERFGCTHSIVAASIACAMRREGKIVPKVSGR